MSISRDSLGDYLMIRATLCYHKILYYHRNYNFDFYCLWPLPSIPGATQAGMKTERLRIFDTTLRDGEQSPGCSMNLEEKVRLARKLEGLGVDIIEAGFPIASEGDFAAVKAVGHEAAFPGNVG